MTLSITDLNSSAPAQGRSSIRQARTGQRLFRDRYNVLRTLGRGGFGITFLAQDMSLPGHPFCVIKQLSLKVKNPIAVQTANQRFEREAETLSKLGSHAQIPRLLDYFEVNGEFYLVQEFVRGATLAREVRQSGPWSEEAVKQFLRQLLPLLQYIHRNRVIHRDIKPQNLIRCQDDGRLVLIDFGAVKEQLVSTDDTERGNTTHFVGTIGFAPPEQLSMRPVYASDLYAVGLTCLYLLTGESPLNLEHDPMTGDIQWQHLVEVSEYFARVLTKMLKTSLADRYQSADEILRALNLEPYLDNLSPCLSVQPSALQLEIDAAKTKFRETGYLTPVARTAVAIRDWRSKAKIRNLRSCKYMPL